MNNLLNAVRRIIEAHKSAKALYLPRLAPDFNMFDFIEPDEMRLSKILAWLLDPRGTHGQGGLFLHLFLAGLGVEVRAEGCERAQVQTEFFILGGRLDILVCGDDFRLAIENKPWATDQNQQLTRYLEWLDTCGQNLYRVVVYLTPKGTPPPKDSITEQERNRRIGLGQLKLWGYHKHLLGWLKKCRAECQSDRVLMFIDDFYRYIRKAFEGVSDSTMSDHIINEIVGSADNVSSAMIVIFLADSLRQRLFQKLGNRVQALLPAHKVDVCDAPRPNYLGLTIQFRAPYKFALEFQGTQYNGLIIGIFGNGAGNQVDANVRQALVHQFGQADQNANQSNEWLWWRYASPTDPLLSVSRDWSQAPEPWTEIANGELAGRITRAFQRVHAVLQGCGVG